jgi:hypothetical protein
VGGCLLDGIFRGHCNAEIMYKISTCFYGSFLILLVWLESLSIVQDRNQMIKSF